MSQTPYARARHSRHTYFKSWYQIYEFRRALPEGLRDIHFGELKLQAVEKAGYKIDVENGVVLGKRGKPLKRYTPPNGRPLVDVRLKLPYPFHKSKIYVHKAVAFKAHGPIALKTTEISPINGDVQDCRLTNLTLR
jgi:hypothetical protein